jgi:hypothetical protein
MPGTSIGFGDIAHLSDKETQIWLRAIDSKVLAAAMKGARRPVRDRILKNVSQRVAVLLEEEGKRTDASQASAARKHAQVLLIDLVKDGSIVWPPTDSEPKKRKPTKKYLSEKRKTLAGTTSLETMEDLNQWLVGIANIARAEGILELGKVHWDATDEFYATALRLIIDGVDPYLAREMLENLAESRLREQETKYRKVIEGVLSTQAGQNPRMIGAKVAAIF